MSVERFPNPPEEKPVPRREFADFRKRAEGILIPFDKLPILTQLKIVDTINELRTSGAIDRDELLKRTRALVNVHLKSGQSDKLKYKSQKPAEPQLERDNMSRELMNALEGIEEKVWSSIKHSKKFGSESYSSKPETHVADKRLLKHNRETVRKQNPEEFSVQA